MFAQSIGGKKQRAGELLLFMGQTIIPEEQIKTNKNKH